MENLVSILKQENLSIGSVESFTVGKFAATLGEVAGISSVYKGSLVTYQNETKERLLNISKDVIKKHGVVSKEVASLMCIHGKQILNTNICVSFTGNAGPEIMENKPVGTIYIGIIIENVVRVHALQLTGSRKEIQTETIQFAINKIKEYLKEEISK